jgi:hypothetical protein
LHAVCCAAKKQKRPPSPWEQREGADLKCLDINHKEQQQPLGR